MWVSPITAVSVNAWISSLFILSFTHTNATQNAILCIYRYIGEWCDQKQCGDGSNNCTLFGGAASDDSDMRRHYFVLPDNYYDFDMIVTMETDKSMELSDDPYGAEYLQWVRVVVIGSAADNPNVFGNILYVLLRWLLFGHLRHIYIYIAHTHTYIYKHRHPCCLAYILLCPHSIINYLYMHGGYYFDIIDI